MLVVCFHITIDFINWRLLGAPAGKGPVWTMLSPTFGALVAAVLVLTVFREAQGIGIHRAFRCRGGRRQPVVLRERTAVSRAGL